ncbi:glycoside hydrolase/deacetylase, partial [Hesseltinella vesiculosa]
STFPFKESYPVVGLKAKPKPEWMDLIKSANISGFPVEGKNGAPSQAGADDPYCDWSFTGCTRPDDIVSCPKGQWGLTYDDGPTDFSSKLYDYLDQSKQKATLFLIGGQVVTYPDLTLRAFKAGHELAMHTWSHSYLTTLTNDEVVAELMWTATAIKDVTGVTPRFYRPPYGDIDDRVRNIGKALGFIPVIWNHDTNDWMAGEGNGFDVEWIDGNVTQWANEAANATVGGISLEHDLYQKSVDAAIRVMPTLQKAYRVMPVGECTGQQAYKE